MEPHQRLLLAFTSLIECIINYSAVYYLVSFYDGIRICKWQSFVHSLQSGLFYVNKLLDKSLYLSHPSALTMLQVTQVITSMTLVFVAFATYISYSTSGKSKDNESE